MSLFPQKFVIKKSDKLKFVEKNIFHAVLFQRVEEQKIILTGEHRMRQNSRRVYICCTHWPFPHTSIAPQGYDMHQCYAYLELDDYARNFYLL